MTSEIHAHEVNVEGDFADELAQLDLLLQEIRNDSV